MFTSSNPAGVNFCVPGSLPLNIRRRALVKAGINKALYPRAKDLASMPALICRSGLPTLLQASYLYLPLYPIKVYDK